MELGLVQLGPYLQFWGAAFLVCTVWLILFQREKMETTEGPVELVSAYKTLWSICNMPRKASMMDE